MSECRDCERRREEVARLNEVLRRKNLELDALHIVWCDGGCLDGVHRWTDSAITEELVQTAERNTARLRKWFNSVRFRVGNVPSGSEWHEQRASDLRKKIGEDDG